MIDEVLDIIFHELFGFVPTVVWGILFLVGGVVTTAVGVVVFITSVKTGGLLIAVGVLIAGAVLVEWYR